MTDLELFLSILNGILLFVCYREHAMRGKAEFVVKMLHMLIGRVGMGHATVVQVGDDGYSIKPTEAGIKAAFQEITLP
jgi:hypothetical protein